MTQSATPLGSIDIQRFEQLLQSYGANADRWPTTERDAALALVQASSDARRLFDETVQLDGILDLAASPEPTAALAARIVAAAEPAPAWREWLAGIAAEIWPFGRQWQAAAILASAAILGLALGTVPLPSTVAENELPIIEELALLTFGPETKTED